MLDLPYLFFIVILVLITFVLAANELQKQSFSAEQVINQGADKVISSETIKNSQNIEEKNEVIGTFPVYISGAVINPGVYYVKKGDIVEDLLLMAGGFSEESARDKINLAAALSPNSHIHILSTSNESDLDSNINDDELSNNGSQNIDGINLNTCSQAELELIPGIGEKTAEAIIRFREEANRVLVLEDLLKVPGIKEKRFEKIKPYFSP